MERFNYIQCLPMHGLFLGGKRRGERWEEEGDKEEVHLRRVVVIVGRVHEEEGLGKVLTSRHMKGLI